MLIQQLRKGTPVFSQSEDGLSKITEWVPPSRLMLRAAAELERNQEIINGFINALATAEFIFADMQETILRQNVIIQRTNAENEAKKVPESYETYQAAGN